MPFASETEPCPLPHARRVVRGLLPALGTGRLASLVITGGLGRLGRTVAPAIILCLRCGNGLGALVGKVAVLLALVTKDRRVVNWLLELGAVLADVADLIAVETLGPLLVLAVGLGVAKLMAVEALLLLLRLGAVLADMAGLTAIVALLDRSVSARSRLSRDLGVSVIIARLNVLSVASGTVPAAKVSFDSVSGPGFPSSLIIALILSA